MQFVSIDKAQLLTISFETSLQVTPYSFCFFNIGNSNVTLWLHSYHRDILSIHVHPIFVDWIIQFFLHLLGCAILKILFSHIKQNVLLSCKERSWITWEIDKKKYELSKACMEIHPYLNTVFLINIYVCVHYFVWRKSLTFVKIYPSHWGGQKVLSLIYHGRPLGQVRNLAIRYTLQNSTISTVCSHDQQVLPSTTTNYITCYSAQQGFAERRH